MRLLQLFSFRAALSTISTISTISTLPSSTRLLSTSPMSTSPMSTPQMSTSPHTVTYILLGGGGLGSINASLSLGGCSSWLNMVEVPYSMPSSEGYKGEGGKRTGRDIVLRAARKGMGRSARDCGTSSIPIGVATSVVYSKANERPGREHKVVCVAVAGDGRTVGIERKLMSEKRSDQSLEVDSIVSVVTSYIRGITPSLPPSYSGVFNVPPSDVEYVYRSVSGNEKEAGVLWPYPMEVEEGDIKGDVTVIPGSFNPLHKGHLEMADVGGKEGVVWFEISLGNVDKPAVTLDDLNYRVSEFGSLVEERYGDKGRERFRLVCTSSPTFAGKARVLKGMGADRVTFVVGSDTYVRVVDEKYYDSKEHMEGIFDGWRREGVGFVVCPRGDILTNEYEGDNGLSSWLGKDDFWQDISSSEIRSGTKDVNGEEMNDKA